MWHWNFSTIVQTERVLKFRYPSAKCGTEILILSSDHSLNSQIWFYTNMVLKFKCSPHIERWALSAYVSIYWLLATRLANHGVVRRVDHGVVSLHPTVCYAGVCTRTMPPLSLTSAQQKGYIYVPTSRSDQSCRGLSLSEVSTGRMFLTQTLLRIIQPRKTCSR